MNYQDVALVELCNTVEPEEARLKQRAAVDAWIAAAPKRSRHSVCPGCGTPGWQGTGRLCRECMTTIVKAAAVAGREQEGAGEPLGISASSHWNEGIPWIGLRDAKVPAEAVFARSNRGRGHEDSPSRLFQMLVTEVCIVALQGFPAIKPGLSAKALLGASASSGWGASGMAPAGFRAAITDLALFVAWATEQAQVEGFERGQNLLAGMAAGSISYDNFAEKVSSAQSHSARMIERLESGKAKH